MRWPAFIVGAASALLAHQLFAAPVQSQNVFDTDGEALTAQQLTLEEFTKRAIENGIQGRENDLSLEQAGYTREIVFRQTEAPTVAVGHVRTRSQTSVNSLVMTSEESRNTTLTVTEQTPLGTSLQAIGGYGDTHGMTAGAPVPANGQHPNLSLSGSQPLYVFVKNPVARTRRRAQLSFADAQSNFRSTFMTLRTQARGFYYDVMLQSESIQVDQRKADSSSKLLDITQALVEAGKTAPVETMRARIRLQTDQRQLTNTKVALNQAVLRAKNFAFIPLDRDVEFVSHLSYRPFTHTLDKLINYALLHQPQLQTLRRARETALLEYQAAIETTRPTADIKGTYNYGEAPGFFNTTSYSRGWTWTLNLNWLFFDSFVTRDTVKNAVIARTVADLNLANGERTAQLNVMNAVMDIRRTEKQISEFQSSREQARHNVDVLRLRFQNGLERLIDVFDAENDMRNLDNEYLNLLVQYNRSKDALSEQLGVDVDTL